MALSSFSLTLHWSKWDTRTQLSERSIIQITIYHWFEMGSGIQRLLHQDMRWSMLISWRMRNILEKAWKIS
jgi:hypothetical protein